MKDRSNMAQALAVGFCLSTISACGGGGGNGDGGGDFFSDDECSPVNAGCYIDSTGFGDGFSISQFDGSWLSACVRLEEYDGMYSTDAAYRMESLDISGKSGNSINNYYTDSSCTTPATTSEVTADLELFYASVFSDNTVGVDNVVLVNITASNLSFDSMVANADQEAEVTRSRADRTFYTSMQRINGALYIGKPVGFTDGSNADDRILSAYSEFDTSYTGVAYTQQ